jgi:hypothetical protein
MSFYSSVFSLKAKTWQEVTMGVDFTGDQEGQTVGRADYFSHINAIGEIIKQAGGMNDLFNEFAGPNLVFLCENLQIDRSAAALFATMVNMYDGRPVTVNQLSECLALKCIEVIQFMDEFEQLEQKGLIQIYREDPNPFPGRRGKKILIFELPLNTIDALRKGTCHELAVGKNLSIDEFFLRLENIFEERVQRRVAYNTTKKKMGDLLYANTHLRFVQKIQSLALFDDDALVLLRFFHYAVNVDEHEMTFHHLEALYDHSSAFTGIKRLLRNGSHVLLEKRLIENTCGDGFCDTDSFQLTDAANEEFLAEFDTRPRNRQVRGLRQPGSITAKDLFYPEKTHRAITELTSLLQPENFSAVQKRLSDNGMRRGFACLFSGMPGTGKTETAFQIARMCGRDIMQIDIATTKSKWFGDSEKQIKALFDKYRACVKKSEVTPILLFNEADAVFGKRRFLSNGYNGPAQTENAIQNIILQEIENLDGILIATTNMSRNMDAAFERRFLYKIEFEKPETETRKAIWLSLIPFLSDEDALALSSRFDFSGGQIENVARKFSIHQVLSGNNPSLKDMMRFCAGENISRKEAKIGFAVS